MLAADPEGLIDEVAALRLEWAQEAARAIEQLKKPKERQDKLFELKNSERFDDRLTAALFEAHQTYEQLRQERRKALASAQRAARLAARQREPT